MNNIATQNLSLFLTLFLQTSLSVFLKRTLNNKIKQYYIEINNKKKPQNKKKAKIIALPKKVGCLKSGQWIVGLYVNKNKEHISNTYY